jgi:hypothetical protein
VLIAKAKSLQRRTRLVRALDYGLGGCLISLGVSLILVFLGNLRLIVVPLPIAIPLMVGLASIIAGLIGLSRRTKAQESLIRTDRELKLKERLSTAYEQLHSGTGNLYTSLLLRDADANAAGVDARRIIPFRFKRRFALLSILLVSVIVLGGFGLPRPKADPQMAAIGEELEELGRRMMVRSEREVLPQTRRLAREIQQLGEQLQNRTTTREEASRLLARITEQAKSQQEDLRERQVTPVSPPSPRSTVEDQLTRTPEDGDFRELDSVSPDQAPDLSLDEMEQGGDAGRGPSTGGADESGDARSLEEVQEALQELAAKLDAGADTEDSLSEGRETASAGETSQAAEASEPMSSETASGSEEPGGEPASEGVDRPAPSGTPGAAPAPDQGDEPGRIPPTADGEPRELPGIVDRGESISTLIRSLPSQNRTGIPEEDVIIEYQKQAEEAIASTQLPRRLKETVRGYFLRIGMTEEDGSL